MRDAPPAPSGALASGYRADIDGLRAVAILLVVAYHAGSTTVAGGYVGVDVFFVVSGYLITGLLLREIDLTGTVSLREFYARRARRLLPLSALVLLTTTVVGAWLLPPLARVDLLADVRASALYVANWRFSQLATTYSDIEVSETPLVHFWSLAIEEQFYVLWPLLMVAGVRYAARRGRPSVRPTLASLLAIIVVTSLTASVVLTPRMDGAAYYVTHTRLWELGVGGGLALLLPRLGRLPRAAAETSGVVGLAAVVMAAVVFDGDTAFPGYAALLPVIGTLLLVVAGTHPRTSVSRLLALRPLPDLGRWSYAWYLWHWPALGFLTLANDRLASPVASPTVVAVAVVGSLLLAGISHHLVENPLRHAQLLRPPLRSLAAGAALTLTPLLAVAAYLAYGDVGDDLVVPSARAEEAGGAEIDAIWAAYTPPQGPVSPSAAAEDVPTSDLPCVPFDAEAPELAAIRPCRFGDPEGQQTVVLVGDSHAAHWLPALHEIGILRSWRVLLATRGSCAVTDVPITDDGEGQLYTDCIQFREDLFDDLDRIGPVHAVMIGRVAHVADRVLDVDGTAIDDTDELAEVWRRGSRRTFERLRTAADHVITLRDTPGAAADVPDCLSDALTDPERCAFPLRPTLDADATLYAAEAAAAIDGVHLLDLGSLVCGSDPCSVVANDGTIKFRDRSHLTSRFARQLAPRVDALLPAPIRGAEPA